MLLTPQTPEQLLNIAEPHAAGSVRIALKAISQPNRIEVLRLRWRRLSIGLAAAAPVLLAIIIAGSLIQTDSALVETIWEITAAGILLAGIAIAFADSRSYYLKPLDSVSTPTQLEEIQQLLARSEKAKAWHDFVVQQGRGLHQFDLEIMWALTTPEFGPPDEDHTHH